MLGFFVCAAALLVFWFMVIGLRVCRIGAHANLLFGSIMTALYYYGDQFAIDFLSARIKHARDHYAGFFFWFRFRIQSLLILWKIGLRPAKLVVNVW